MPDLRTELTESIDQAEWEWLKPHIARDTVVVVANGLELVDVGMAIADDQVSTVQHWISEQLIAKPNTDQIQRWNSNENQRFTALIVQPYVLIQEQAA